MLVQLFSSETRVRLLGVLLTHPDEKFHTRELERLTGIGVNSVRRELLRLERLGLVSSARVGNLRLHAVNRQFPLYTELRSMVLKTVGLSEPLRDILGRIPGVIFAFVFGSVAAGEADAHSDIDIMLVGTVDMTAVSAGIAAAENELGRSLSLVAFEPDEIRQRLAEGDPFLTNVFRSPILLILGTEDELRRFGASGPDQAIQGKAQ